MWAACGKLFGAAPFSAVAALVFLGCGAGEFESPGGDGDSDASSSNNDAQVDAAFDGAQVDAAIDGRAADSARDASGDARRDGTVGSDSTINCSATGGDRRAQVCQRWVCDRKDMREGSWSGAVNSCSAGDVAEPTRTNTLKMVNLYRFMADLPAVTLDPALTPKAQKCALAMHANNSLSHTPPTTWACYSADGAEAAGKSNIATTPAVEAVDLYMKDPGASNALSLGHRRWILSNSLGPIGVGSTSDFSCMWVIGGTGTVNKAWTAWPPPGPVPFEAWDVSFGDSLDVTGWSIQSSAINLTAAQVQVTEGGQVRPVTVSQLGQNYGSRWGIRFVPNGWQTAPGKTYHVVVSGLAQPITYDVEVVSCNF